MNQEKNGKTLVLVGGGHTHVEVVRRFSNHNKNGYTIIVINPEPYSLYSGMIPGVISGHIDWNACRIDLQALAKNSDVRLILGSVVNFNPQRNAMVLSTGDEIPFDICSFDIGSQPALNVFKGVEHAVGVKPLLPFLERWNQFLSHGKPDQHAQINMIGAGAAGVEIILAMEHRLQQTGLVNARCNLITAKHLLMGYPDVVIERVRYELEQRNIHVIENTKVEHITPDSLILHDNTSIASDFTAVAIHAMGAEWLNSTGFPITENHFLPVDDCLNVLGYPHIFAVGDVAELTPAIPKAGVYAVRQGPVLFDNIQRLMQGRALQPYLPQSKFLSILSLGNKTAVASRPPFYMSGSLAWHYKQWIDRRFMKKYQIC